ncbi:MAG: glutaminyl-peptide cyclotransferase, partial [Acidobacteria bacterium]|nr:glutaminyl-peptide cyclotransferase [Acidobacteriota bacterium]
MQTKSAGTFALLLFLTLPACGDTANSSQRSATPSAATPAPAQANAQNPAPPSSVEIPVYTYEIVATYPHDKKAYTQGLAFDDGLIYESTGQYDESSLRKVELKKGKVKKKIDLPGQYFAEGMTILNGKIYQLTWHQHKVFVYDLDDFKLERELTYEGEAWGLTNDGQSLILSDGSNQLRFIDPATFRVQKTLSVLYNNMPLAVINELEYIKGEIYANVWKTDR